MKTPAAQTDLKTVRAENRTGANVLCLHGMFAGNWVFDGLLPMIAARGHNASALSFRGHPPVASIARIGKVSVLDYANDACEAAKDLDRPIVIGHSLGGLVAMMMMGRSLVRAAVLISPAPPRGIAVLSPEILLRIANYLPSMLLSRPMLIGERDLNALVLNKVPAGERRALCDRFVHDSGRVAREVALGRWKVPPRAVRAPILVVGSSDDRFIPAKTSEKVAKKYAAQFHLAHGHGHFLLAEPGWQQPANVMLDWIQQLPRNVRDLVPPGDNRENPVNTRGIHPLHISQESISS